MNQAVWLAAALWVVASSATLASDLLQEVLDAPPATIDAVLTAHKAEVGPDLVVDLTRRAVDQADAGRLAEGQRDVQLADHIDAWLKPGQPFEGMSENALTINLMQERRYTDAIEVAGDLVKTHPELFRPHFLLGSAYYESGQMDPAVEQLETATRLRPTNEEALMELAYAYVRMGRPEDGAKAFQAVLGINPDNGRARDALAILAGSVTSAQRTSTSSPAAAEAFNHAETLFESQHYREAIAEYQRALDADPHLSRAAVYMGDAWLQLGDLDSAIGCYQKAIAINPKDRQAHRFLGSVYEQLYDQSHHPDDLERAIQQYQKAVDADPSYETAREDLDRARALRPTQ